MVKCASRFICMHARPADPALARAAAPAIVGGSHDLLLELALRESGCGLASLPEGSKPGLRRLTRGEVMIAAIHLHGLESDDAQANVSAVADAPGLRDAVLISFARREQGIVTAPGNPLKLSDIASVAKSRARLAQLLLRALLARANIAANDLALMTPVCTTGMDIRTGGALEPRRLRYRHTLRCAGSGPELSADHVGAL